LRRKNSSDFLGAPIRKHSNKPAQSGSGVAITNEGASVLA
jgi:hypothetical protein